MLQHINEEVTQGKFEFSLLFGNIEEFEDTKWLIGRVNVSFSSDPHSSFYMYVKIRSIFGCICDILILGSIGYIKEHHT